MYFCIVPPYLPYAFFSGPYFSFAPETCVGCRRSKRWAKEKKIEGQSVYHRLRRQQKISYQRASLLRLCNPRNSCVLNIIRSSPTFSAGKKVDHFSSVRPYFSGKGARVQLLLHFHRDKGKHRFAIIRFGRVYCIIISSPSPPSINQFHLFFFPRDWSSRSFQFTQSGWENKKEKNFKAVATLEKQVFLRGFRFRLYTYDYNDIPPPCAPIGASGRGLF